MSAIQPPRIYLDHAAATPVLPAAAEAWADGVRRWANPSSPHTEGRAARAALEEARVRIADALGWTGEVVLTSGASESLALALGGRDVLASAVEHDAVRRAAPLANTLPVDGLGRVEVALVADKLTTDQRVAIQHANGETGVVQPLAGVAPLVEAAGAVLVVDASQSAGRVPLPPGDILVVSGHKVGTPPGIAALLVRDLALLTPTGGQEGGYRPGTENLPGALALAAALESKPVDHAPLRARLDGRLEEAGGIVIAKKAERLVHVGAVAMPGVSAAAQLMRLDAAGIAVSAGSACASGAIGSSTVLAAMKVPDDLARSTIRVSFGRGTAEEEIDRFVVEWRRIAGR